MGKGSTRICILFDLKDKPRNKQKEKESSKTVDTKTNHDHHGVRGNKRISFCNISHCSCLIKTYRQSHAIVMFSSISLSVSLLHTRTNTNLNHKTTFPLSPPKKKLEEMNSFSSV